MTDAAAPSPPAGSDGPPPMPPGQEPPPLGPIRIKGPRAKGLNKRGILVAAGGGVGLVLVLASGALSSGTSRLPAETKLMMSDPARPEMAQGAIRSLPTDYTQAARNTPKAAPVSPPEIGPPLPGDIAAFAPTDPVLRGRSAGPAYDWETGDAGAENGPASREEDEAMRAERSGLFFTLRSEAGRQGPSPGRDEQPGARRPLTATPPNLPDADLPRDTINRSLFPGAVIPASLVTELSSESPGPVIAQVTQATYDSATGRTLLIPQGARLIGEYKSSTRYGQSRIAIAWTRLILPDGTERALDEIAVAPDGAAGVGGETDSHWGDVFGAAVLGTLINVGVATTEDPQLSFSGIGAVSRDPVDAAIAEGVQRSASTLSNRVIDRGLAIPPTIRVEAGARISIIVTRRSTF